MLKMHALRDSAAGVTARLMPLEESFDRTISQAADLLAFLPMARQQAGLPMGAGQAAMKHILTSLNAMFDARCELVAAHAEFATIRDELRVPITDTGSLEGCPSMATLKLVDAA